MKFRKLSKKEIDGVNLFVSDVKELSIVECVYIVPYRDVSTNKEGARVVTIFNESLEYNKSLDDVGECVTDCERNDLDSIIINYNCLFANSNFTFSVNNSNNYNLRLFLYKEKISLKSLVSGVILFDRFGDILKVQKQACNQVEPFRETIQLRNMETILPTEVSYQYLKKSDN